MAVAAEEHLPAVRLGDLEPTADLRQSAMIARKIEITATLIQLKETSQTCGPGHEDVSVGILLRLEVPIVRPTPAEWSHAITGAQALREHPAKGQSQARR